MPSRTSAEHFSQEIHRTFSKMPTYLVLRHDGGDQCHAGVRRPPKPGSSPQKAFATLSNCGPATRKIILNIALPAPYPIVTRQRRLGVTGAHQSPGGIVLDLNEQEVYATRSVNLKQLWRSNQLRYACCFSFKTMNTNSASGRSSGRNIRMLMFPCPAKSCPRSREFDRFQYDHTEIAYHQSETRIITCAKLEVSLNEAGFGGRLFIQAFQRRRHGY